MPTTLLEEKPTNITIPEVLVYEELNGKKRYRQGYKEVLNHSKTIEEIMGSSSLQASIIAILMRNLITHLKEEEYEILTNEVGLHVSLGNNLSSDILIYSHHDFVNYKLDLHYFNVAPKLVMEVDIKIDLEKTSDIDYVTEKSQTLFSFGVERVVWFFTHNKKTLLAAPAQDWILRDWSKDIDLIGGHTINLQELIEKKGLVL